jgi:hypothetical protein
MWSTPEPLAGTATPATRLHELAMLLALLGSNLLSIEIIYRRHPMNSPTVSGGRGCERGRMLLRYPQPYRRGGGFEWMEWAGRPKSTVAGR